MMVLMKSSSMEKKHRLQQAYLMHIIHTQNTRSFFLLLWNMAQTHSSQYMRIHYQIGNDIASLLQFLLSGFLFHYNSVVFVVLLLCAGLLALWNFHTDRYTKHEKSRLGVCDFPFCFRISFYNLFYVVQIDLFIFHTFL